MAVTLTSSDLAHLGDAVRLLVSPFDHDGVDGWRSAVLAHLRPLLGADSAGFLLPVPGQLPFYSNEQDLGELNTYPDVPPPPDVNGVPGLVKSAELGVATLAMAYEGDPSEYFASAHYNEHAAPHHSHDTLMMTAVGPEVAGLSSLHFWHDRPTGPTFGDREVALLRVLRPAFMAGIRSTVAWTRQHRSADSTAELRPPTTSTRRWKNRCGSYLWAFSSKPSYSGYWCKQAADRSLSQCSR